MLTPLFPRNAGRSAHVGAVFVAGTVVVLAALVSACGGAPASPTASVVRGAPVASVLAKTRPAAALAPNHIALGETRPLGTAFQNTSIAAAHTIWLRMINDANAQLDIAQFYIANQPGSRLEAVITAIEQAVTRGVKVRLLVDAIFAKKYPKTLDRLRAKAQVRTYDVKARMGGVLHAKYFIVDRKAVWLGSQNFDWRSLAHIHELGVRCNVAAVVAPLQATFDLDWRLAAEPVGSQSSVRLSKTSAPVFSPAKWRATAVSIAPVGSPVGFLPPGLAWELPALVKWLDGAKSSVRVQVLSMHRRARDGSDFPDLYEALRRAASRGVKVSILVAHWSKSRHSAQELSTLQRVPGITVRFVTIPQHSSGFIAFARVIHSKYLVVDDARTWVGTSNWSKGYFTGSRNVGVLVRGAAFAAAVARVFDGLWAGPYAETLVPGKRYPRQRVAR